MNARTVIEAESAKAFLRRHQKEVFGIVHYWEDHEFWGEDDVESPLVSISVKTADHDYALGRVQQQGDIWRIWDADEDVACAAFMRGGGGDWPQESFRSLADAARYLIRFCPALADKRIEVPNSIEQK